MKRTKRVLILTCLAVALPAADLAPVVSKPVSRSIQLPGEFLPFLKVSLHAKVPGYIERLLVDRGTVVKQGDLLVELSAPELQARIREAESKVPVAEADRVQAEAQLVAAQSTYERLAQAAKTPGAVAANEVIQAEKQVDAAQALVRSRQQAQVAAQATVETQKDMEAYLRITAPFDGVVTDRLADPGALVGPGADAPLLVIQQISRLRLTVPVPEEDVGGISPGGNISFHVPAYPDRNFSGTVARIAHALDPKTRTMPVELDVINRDGSLAPGMYPVVMWPVRRTRPALYVPRSSVVTTTERTFVVRDQQGRAEWVDVRMGALEGDLVEVAGSLHGGDKVVRRATDEIREGTEIESKNR
jgi:membrane fusion protein (multidrug efflux system)